VALVVEFAGISCSGKSTALTAIFSKTANISVVDSEDVIRKYLEKKTRCLPFFRYFQSNNIIKVVFLLAVHFKYVFKYAQFYNLCMKQILKTDNIIKSFRSFFFKVGKYFLLKKTNEEKILMDEGPVQMLFALFVQARDLDKKSMEALNNIINVMPLPDEVVFGPDQPESLFVERILSRGHHRVTGKCHKSGKLTSEIFSEEEKEIRAREFTVRSIDLQRLIVSAVSDKVSIYCLESTEDWDNVVEKYNE